MYLVSFAQIQLATVLRVLSSSSQPRPLGPSLFPGCPSVPQPWHCSGKQIYHAIVLQSDIPGSDKLALCNTLLLHWHELKPAGEQLGSRYPAMEQGSARSEQILIWPIISLQWGDRTSGSNCSLEQMMQLQSGLLWAFVICTITTCFLFYFRVIRTEQGLTQRALGKKTTTAEGIRRKGETLQPLASICCHVSLIIARSVNKISTG